MKNRWQWWCTWASRGDLWRGELWGLMPSSSLGGVCCVLSICKHVNTWIYWKPNFPRTQVSVESLSRPSLRVKMSVRSSIPGKLRFQPGVFLERSLSSQWSSESLDRWNALNTRTYTSVEETDSSKVVSSTWKLLQSPRLTIAWIWSRRSGGIISSRLLIASSSFLQHSKRVSVLGEIFWYSVAPTVPKSSAAADWKLTAVPRSSVHGGVCGSDI